MFSNRIIFNLISFICLLFVPILFSSHLVAQQTSPEIVVSSSPLPPGEIDVCTCHLGEAPNVSEDCVSSCVSESCSPLGWNSDLGYVHLNGGIKLDCTDDPPVEPPPPPACTAGATDGGAYEDGGACVQMTCVCDAGGCGFVPVPVDESLCGGGWGPSPTPTSSPQP